MFEILKKEELAANIFLMDVKAPRVAKSGYPGQFVIVKIDSKGERIPLTICDYDREAGIITIVFQTVGASTKMMARLEAGDYFQDVVGPLGRPSELIGLTPWQAHQLRGKNSRGQDVGGHFSFHVTANWRLVFRYDSETGDVELTDFIDYH